MIRIGHDTSGTGDAWFLDKVIIKDPEEGEKQFTFLCDRYCELCCQSINQLISQTINQSISLSINQSINRCSIQSIFHSSNH